MLGDVKIALPPGVWLTTFQGQHTVPTPTAAGARGATGSTPTGTSGSTGPISSARNGAAATSAQQNALGANAGSATPGGVGSASRSGAVAAAASCDLSGNVTMSGIAKDYPSIAAFLDALAQDNDVTAVWPVSMAKQDKLFAFSVSVDLAPGARSSRIAQYLKGATCK
jgi:hypothetical protein